MSWKLKLTRALSLARPVSRRALADGNGAGKWRGQVDARRRASYLQQPFIIGG
jgi:hypothetical protein